MCMLVQMDSPHPCDYLTWKTRILIICATGISKSKRYYYASYNLVTGFRCFQDVDNTNEEVILRFVSYCDTIGYWEILVNVELSNHPFITK